MDINSIDKFYMLHYIAACHPRNKKELKGKRYAQNKDAAKLNMMEYREKKKDLIQLSNSNEYKIKNSKKVNYEENTGH